MKHGALFNGIGGFQLAAHWMEWENIFHCEIDKFCNQVIKKHFPESICYEDIKETGFTKWRGAIDILSGGFPCQPYSIAGKRKGFSDDRHLWPEMLRAIREVSPRWVVGENVRGLTNWNGGMVFDEVQADLEAEGYEVLPFLLPAAGVDAPHERYRIWFVAYACSAGSSKHKAGIIQDKKWHNTSQVWEESLEQGRAAAIGQTGSPANTSIVAERKQAAQTEPVATSRTSRFVIGGVGGQWEGFPTQSPVCGGDDGLPNWVDQLKSLGNAIVPQVAVEIFRAIEAFEKL